MSEKIATPFFCERNDAESENVYLPFPVVELREVHHLQQSPPHLQVFQIFSAYKKLQIFNIKVIKV